MTTIIGQTIKELRPMTQAELDQEGWTDRHEVFVMILSNGVKLYPSQDYEGNAGGVWFGVKDKESFAI